MRTNCAIEPYNLHNKMQLLLSALQKMTVITRNLQKLNHLSNLLMFNIWIFGQIVPDTDSRVILYSTKRSPSFTLLSGQVNIGFVCNDSRYYRCIPCSLQSRASGYKVSRNWGLKLVRKDWHRFRIEPRFIHTTIPLDDIIHVVITSS